MTSRRSHLAGSAARRESVACVQFARKWTPSGSSVGRYEAGRSAAGVITCRAVALAQGSGGFGFAFVRDHTRGAPLALVVVMLVIFALDVPVIIAFTVARYSSPPYSLD